ncbi:MAG: DNA polymerase III subunit gamma/tau [Erysipelotrichaceae bacterium]|nr:DNA polymerase III subunit gamma/tau [Erysipelotrichaceae bacterium]
MSRVALYQKYRSSDFDEVVGQEYVVRSIRNAIREGKVGHAYLFCGPRGTGKTTMARLLAKSVNCENPAEAPCGHCLNCEAAAEGTHPDIIEINAANETHVEDIRDLIDRARLAPMVGHHKIYIVDEVHQLSSSAASALLKTLEEPPSHVIFILATTDPQKLLPTIVSRCQRFDFSKVDREKIKNHLLNISGKEGFRLEPAAAEKIAELADGGMRDALSILEQTVSYAQGSITEEDINQIYGLSSTSQKIDLLKKIQSGDLASVIEMIRSCEQRGINLERMNSELIDILRDTVLYKTTAKTSLLRVLSEDQAVSAGEGSTVKSLLKMIDALMKALDTYKISQSQASCFEIACMNMMTLQETETEYVPPVRTVQPAVKPEPVKAAVEVKTEEPKPVLADEQSYSGAEDDTAAPQPEIPAPAAAPAEPDEHELSVDEVLNLLLQSDKQSKTEDQAKLSPLINSMQMNRYLNNLRSCTVAASGKNTILFTSSMPAIVNRINDAVYNRELYEYLKDFIHIDKMPFAAEEQLYSEAVKEFISRRKTGTLPEVRQITKYSEETEQQEDVKPDPEQQLIQLFGSDLVQIIDEGGK